MIRSGSIPTSLRLSKNCEGIDLGAVEVLKIYSTLSHDLLLISC